jgi:hygromycin-B 7''-O-kinase
VLERHGLAEAGQAPVAGYNATYPTFVCGEVVVKLFGITRTWRLSHATERAALALLATDPEIAAPRLLADGRLSDQAAEPWPYLVTSRIPGVRLSQAGVTADERRAVVTELGQQVRRIHALPASDAISTDADWAGLDVVAGAERSSLPPPQVAPIPH